MDQLLKEVLTGAEVIIIDDYSNDKTAEIVENNGGKIIKQKWLGRGRQKRVAEDAASNKWLLDIDSDELLSYELINEIKKIFEFGEPEPGIYSLKYIVIPPVRREVFGIMLMLIEEINFIIKILLEFQTMKHGINLKFRI